MEKLALVTFLAFALIPVFGMGVVLVYGISLFIYRVMMR